VGGDFMKTLTLVFNPVLEDRNAFLSKLTPTTLTSEIEHPQSKQRFILCGSVDDIVQERFNEHMRKSIQ
jgi:hypothetical protein